MRDTPWNPWITMLAQVVDVHVNLGSDVAFVVAGKSRLETILDVSKQLVRCRIIAENNPTS
jgi:hypothetical protein